MVVYLEDVLDAFTEERSGARRAQYASARCRLSTTSVRKGQTITVDGDAVTIGLDVWQSLPQARRSELISDVGVRPSWYGRDP